MDEPSIDLYERSFRSLNELLATLTDAEWATPTECPGWDVKDVISHVLFIERQLLGLPSAPPLESYPAHVKNDVGRRGEDAAAARRALPPAAVRDEFADITARRLAQMRSMTTEDFDKIGWSPIGDVPYREFMLVRVFDLWAHEQDIRRAVARPGHLTGPVVAQVLRWHRRNLPYVVGKRAAAPDGTSVRFVVTGATNDDVTVEVAGRARVADPPSEPATATITTGLASYNALLCGRITADDALRAGEVTISGDRALAEAVLRAANYLF